MDYCSLARGAVVMSNAGSVAHALTLAAAGVDCVVIQGSDAGGHTHPGASAFAVLPEARDALDAAGHAEVLLAYAGGRAPLYFSLTHGNTFSTPLN